MMTGDDVRAVREAVGLSGRAFAALLHVHEVTYYRWENSGPEAVPIEGLPGRLLQRTSQLIKAGKPIDIDHELVRLLVVEGSLHALQRFLTKILG